MAPKQANTGKAASKKDTTTAKASTKTSTTSKVTKTKGPSTKAGTTHKDAMATKLKAATARATATKAAKIVKVPTANGVSPEESAESAASSAPSKKPTSEATEGLKKVPIPTSKTKPGKVAVAEPATKKPSRKASSAAASTEEAAEKLSAISLEGKKRKLSLEEETVPVKRALKKARVTPTRVVINQAPTQKLNVYVCGEGSSGELGLGSAKIAVDVKRPRLNPFLPADTVGVVQVAVGGMHVAALTHDNKVLTWGVNDQGALGRDTSWDGGLRDVDAMDDSDSDSGSDSGLNPRESTPTAIPEDSFPEGTKIVEVAAADSSTFAITDDGRVFGWGTFRSNDGVLGFNQEVRIQTTPLLVPELKKIKHIAAGSNHILALTEKGSVFAWGSGQQNQLGRRVVERTKKNGLVPREFGLPKNKISFIECGSYHSFAIDKAGKVWTWGLNNFGETGVAEGAGDDDAVVLAPAVVKCFNGRGVKQIKGGNHHSIAVTEKGECLVWGRLDGYQVGIKLDDLPKEDLVFDEKNRPRILKTPTAVPGLKVKYATAGSDSSIAITTEGQAYSWGFSANYQTGQGTTDDVEVARLIDNTALRGKKLNWAAAGGQFSVFTAPAEEQKPLVNGE